MIDVHEEPKEIQREFGKTMELCQFCKVPTRFWDASKKHSVCTACAQKHTTNDLKRNQ